jgi:cytochrome b561
MMQRYTRTAMLLHWLMALMIVSNFALGVTMVDIPGLTPTKLKYFSWHKWLGVTVLALACMRLLWRLFHPAPPYPSTMRGWEKAAARGTHGLLYVLMFAVPLSGYFLTLALGVPVVYLGIVELPVLIDRNPALKEPLETLHYVLNMILLAAVCVHVLAAFKHHLIDRDRIFKRILS